MSERNTFDWGSLENSHIVTIGKVIASETLDGLEIELGHPLAVNEEAPTCQVVVDELIDHTHHIKEGTIPIGQGE